MLHLIIAPIIIAAVVISIVTRILFRPYWSPYRRHGFYYDPYNRYGYRHRHGGLLSLLAILAICRLFGRRW